MNTSGPATLTQRIVDRVCNEYLEMPGLRLTPRQAQRLWGLDEHTCTALLEYLVAVKFLARRTGDLYVRLADGAVTLPRLLTPMPVIDQRQNAGSLSGRDVRH
jgi:hypothetical protein